MYDVRRTEQEATLAGICNAMPYKRGRLCGRARLVYQRPSAIVWTNLGGIAFAGVAIYITIHVGLFAVTSGLRPANYLGVPYDTPAVILTTSDVRHLRIGGAISDSEGEVFIDPQVDVVIFATVDGHGLLTLETRSPSTMREIPPQTMVVLQTSSEAPYEGFVAALDELRRERVLPGALWMAEPIADMPPN